MSETRTSGDVGVAFFIGLVLGIMATSTFTNLVDPVPRFLVKIATEGRLLLTDEELVNAPFNREVREAVVKARTEASK